ncbi:hypothetical protein DFH09DRAFT_1067492 [Mycena vulgaris]|nr:hypothetical protein DFH09DRAFT_1067492 [Mycena vulgaris]
MTIASSPKLWTWSSSWRPQTRHSLRRCRAQSCTELRRQAELRASQSAAKRAVAREEAEAAALEKLAAERRALAERNKHMIQDHVASESERLQPPITVASRSSRDSTSSTHCRTTCSFLVAPSTTPGSKPATVPATDPNPSERITHDFNSRVITQKYRKDEIVRQGFSGITDQNIAWTAEGVPYEMGRAPSRGSSIGAGIRPRTSTEPKSDATRRPDANSTRQPPLGEPNTESSRVRAPAAPPAAPRWEPRPSVMSPIKEEKRNTTRASRHGNVASGKKPVPDDSSDISR